MKLFNYDSPFWSFLNKIADLVLLNVLWLVFCIPIITIGASTAAMYRVTLNMHRGEGGEMVMDKIPVPDAWRPQGAPDYRERWLAWEKWDEPAEKEGV